MGRWAKAVVAAVTAAGLLGAVRSASAQNASFSGRQTERLPVVEQAWEERQCTVYRDQWQTEWRTYNQSVWSPVTQWYAIPHVHNRWNPFAIPYVDYHVRPVTRWVPRCAQYQVPVMVNKPVAETRTVRVPVRKLRFAEREIPAPLPARSYVTNAPRLERPAPEPEPEEPRYGGIARLDMDQPLRSSQLPGAHTIR